MISITSLDKIGNRGLYSSRMFNNALPSGRAGKTITIPNPRGVMTYKLGAKIGTREHLLAATIVSNMLNDLGDDFKRYKDNPDIIKVLEDEPDYVGNPRLAYTYIIFNLQDLAQQMYGDRKYAKRLKTSFENLQQLLTVYENEKSLLNPKKQIINISHFKDFSYKDRRAQIGISNLMLQTIIPFVRGIRLSKVLQYRNKTAELMLYIEHNQYRTKKGSYPKQTYSLNEIASFLCLSERVEKEKGATIKEIQNMFDEIHKKDKDFPKYIFDKNKNFFHNKYKRSSAKNLFE